MKKPCLLTLTLLCTFLLPPSLHAQTTPAPAVEGTLESVLKPNTPASFADIVEGLLPAVVNISSTQKAPQRQQAPDFRELQDFPAFPEGSPFEHFFEEFMTPHHRTPLRPQSAMGSGFIIDAENGYIITNNHVVGDADEIRVTLHDDTSLPATLIGTDKKTDIAVLKVETDRKLSAVPFGNSDVLRVGDWIVAIGNPFGLGGTVTAGIVSARQRNINAGPYDDFIQTDASINRGNSGGPMFDLSGEVIGINTAIFSPTGGSVGIGFAIPSTLAKPVIDQIIQFGHTRRGWLGVRIQRVTDEIAESLGLDSAKGALVADVTLGGPAEKANMQAGDIILKLNSQDVEDVRALPRLVAEAAIDSSAQVTYWRDGKEHTATVQIGELEKAEKDGLLENRKNANDNKKASGLEISDVGITVKTINETMRSDYNIDRRTQGVAITHIDPSSEATTKGLFEGDVIVEINQRPVTTPSDVKTIIEAAKKAQKSSILLLINREGEVRFTALKLKK